MSSQSAAGNDHEMIDKPVIIVTSTGRTGTEFFARFFADVIPDCTSLHEPDIIKVPGVSNRLTHYRDQLATAGIWRLIVLKALGKWTLVRLSDERFLGHRDEKWASRSLLAQRRSFVAGLRGSIYAESNLGYYGLLDVAPAVFTNHRAVYIVRDGRDWIRSAFNWGEVYGKSKLRRIFSHNWPEATALPDDPYSKAWDGYSRFERLCWAWARLNEFALNSIPRNPSARLIRFEDIFVSASRQQHLDQLMDFVTQMPGMERSQLGNTRGWLDRKIHESAAAFPRWNDWTPAQKTHFKQVCGGLMERLGYEF